MEKSRATFGSKLGIIAATAGSAIGLGNIWRFPSETANGGGALFLLIYVVFVLFFGLPVVLGEFILGRAGKANAAGAYRNLDPEKPFHFFGIFSVCTAIFILGFYMVVAGWTFEYFALSVTGTLDETKDFAALFANLTESFPKQILWLGVSVLITGTIVAFGVKRGIELASKIMMPMLFLILLVMGIRAVTLPGAAAGLAFLFQPKLENFTWSVVPAALGQSFFSLSLGMGCLITYSSYFGKEISLRKTAAEIAILDTFFALFAGVIIFSTAFAVSGTNVSEITGTLKNGGPGLIFETLPSLFETLPFGTFWSSLFFVLLILATITSAISLFEIPTAFIREELKISRKKSVALVCCSTLLIGCLSAASLSGTTSCTIFGTPVFDFLDNLTANWMMPLGGLFVSWFVGWRLDKKILEEQLNNGSGKAVKFFSAYVFILRFVAPIGIAAIFFTRLF